ncbi:Rab GTPase-activating protein 22 [Linum grandiflorum]
MKALRRSHTSSASSNTPSPSTSSSSSASGSGTSSASSSSSSSSWVHLRSVLFVVNSSSPAHSCHSDRGRLKSPWSRRKRKHVLTPQQWCSLFTPDGKLRDGGVKFLKKVRSGNKVLTLGLYFNSYELDSTKEERELLRTQKRKEYEKLRRQCRRLLRRNSGSLKSSESGETIDNEDDGGSTHDTDSSSHEDVVSARESLSSEAKSPDIDHSDDLRVALLEVDDNHGSQTPSADASAQNTESSDTESSEDSVVIQATAAENREDTDANVSSKEDTSPSGSGILSMDKAVEDFATWQRIIRVDALRANPEWIPYSPSQASISEARAQRSAAAVGLKDHDHLEPCRIFHAARLVAILEAYALYDPEIGYCQGMSDLLSPIIAVMQEDHEAFWCFVGFMKKARHNFRLDEVGIRRQLSIVSKIIKFKDSHLYRHLEKLQAEDCFFVYRMVVVLFRRELSFEQTLCLWEVMWADQAAIRAGIGKSAGSRIRQRVPPTDDLLLYAIAASVLQKRKLIIEKYSSMDEILKECNGMSGHLDVWKLLDDAHNLVVNLHEKVESHPSF